LSAETVLIVEDQVITALDLKCTLKCCGYSNCKIIGEGKKAIEYIENQTPSIVFLDVKLGDDVSGIQVAKKLKQKNIPFIFMSAFSDPEDLKQAEQLNPMAIFKKPLSFDKIKSFLHVNGEPAV